MILLRRRPFLYPRSGDENTDSPEEFVFRDDLELALCNSIEDEVPVFEREARVKFYETFECAFERCAFE